MSRPTTTLKLIALLLLSLFTFTLAIGDSHKVPTNIPLPSDFDEIDRLPPQTIVVNRWPLSAGSDESKRVAFGMIRYSAGTMAGKYTPVVGGTEVGDKETYRVGSVRAGRWVGSVVNADLLRDDVAVAITIRVDIDGTVWNVKYDGIRVSKGEPIPEPTIDIVRSTPGATPHLNRPVVLTPEGKVPEVPVEKTFLQKYWMVIAGVMFMLVLGGGGDK